MDDSLERGKNDERQDKKQPRHGLTTPKQPALVAHKECRGGGGGGQIIHMPEAVRGQNNERR